MTESGGQSLIELALALPLLLAVLLGMVDGARAYYVAGIIANGGREGANFAARNANATQAQVTQRACDVTGFASFGASCPGMQVTCVTGDGDVTVEVRYDFALLTGSVVDAAFKINPIPVRSVSRLPIMTGGTPCAA